MTLFDEPSNYKNTRNREIVQPISPALLQGAPLPQEENPLPEATTEKECTEMNDNPTYILPGASSTQLPPSINREPTRRELFYSPMIDGSAIDEQPTWIIPVIPGTRKMAGSPSESTGTDGYVSLVRNLVKSSGIYALSSVASPLVSLILAPFLTRALSHHDYGALVVLNTLIALMVGITQFGLNSAFFRAYNYDYESQRDRLRVVSTVVSLLLLISIPVTIAVSGAGSWLAILLFKSSSLSGAVRLAALVVLMQNLTIPGFSWLRAENRAMLFSSLAIINLLVNLVTTIILVSVLHLGIAGSLLGIGGGYAVVVACTLPIVLLRAGLRIHFDVARNLLSFGIPLVTSFVTIWILQLSDRYLLSSLGSLAQTASYGVAYSLGGVISVVVLSPFSLSWPAAMFAIAKRDDAAHVFQFVFRWFSIALLFITFSFSLVGMGVLILFFPLAYHSAAPIIPIIAASTMFYGLYSFFTTGVAVRRKNWLGIIYTAFSALLNIGLNFVLIPLYGAIGAALSTLVAYIALAFIAYVINQRIYYIPYKLGIFIAALLVGIALFIAGSFLAQAQQFLAAAAIYIAALAVYSLCLVMLGGPLTLINMYKNWRAREDFKLWKK